LPHGGWAPEADELCAPENWDAAVYQAQQTNKKHTVTMVSKGINYGRLIVNANRTVDTGLLRGVDADLRIKPFFAHGGLFGIRQFIVNAFNDEMGLEASDPILETASDGQYAESPAGMVFDGTLDDVPAPRL
jgi:hypothetical protein